MTNVEIFLLIVVFGILFITMAVFWPGREGAIAAFWAFLTSFAILLGSLYFLGVPIEW
jgi:hypothetical protein